MSAYADAGDADAASQPSDNIGSSLTVRSVKRLLRRRLAVACLVVIGLFYFAGIFAPLVAPYSYEEQNLDISFQQPSLHHLFGTDRLGRDVLSRNMFAARTTVVVTAATFATGFILLPLTLGMLAGYRGGFTDAFINRAGEIFGSIPGLPMLILVSATMRPKFNNAVSGFEGRIHYHGLTSSGFSDYFLIFGVLSLFGWVGGARLVRTQVLGLRGSEYVLSARASGASTKRILFQHILPNITPIVIVGASASLGSIALTEIGLTYLGVGIQAPHPSFGALITDGASRSVLENHPALLIVPATVVASLIFAFNLLGDALNDVFTSRAQ